MPVAATGPAAKSPAPSAQHTSDPLASNSCSPLLVRARQGTGLCTLGKAHSLGYIKSWGGCVGKAMAQSQAPGTLEGAPPGMNVPLFCRPAKAPLTLCFMQQRTPQEAVTTAQQAEH